MTQIITLGGDVDHVEFRRHRKCSDYPPPFFHEDGRMRTGTKSSLVKTLKEMTKVASTPTLPEHDGKAIAVSDAMYVIRHWSFSKGEGLEPLLKGTNIKY